MAAVSLAIAGCSGVEDRAAIGDSTGAVSVSWTNAVGVDATGSSLRKTDPRSRWNAGAVSVESIAADGYVEFMAGENDTSKMAGLSAGDSGQHYSDIDFALHLKANGVFAVYEGGVLRGQNFGTYAPGDLFKIENVRGVIVYWHNNVPFYTSGVAPSSPLLVDTSLFTPGATLLDVVLVSNVIEWQNESGVDASPGDLTKTDPRSRWNAGAASVQALLFDGYLEFTTDENTTSKMAGLNNEDGGHHYDEIDFAIHLKPNGVIAVYESGVLRGKNFGTYAAGDWFRIESHGGIVTYAKNGAVFYTSSLFPPYPMVADTSLFTPGATIRDATLRNTGGGGCLLVEKCDGLDNDCDGFVDEDYGVGDACDDGGLGECRDGGVTACDPDDTTQTQTVCDLSVPPDPDPGAPAPETCNGLDDDCDGVVDETVPEPCQPSAPSFAPPVTYTVGAYPFAVAIGDLDQDGDADVVVGNANSQSVSVLRGNGNGTLQPAVNYSAAPGGGPYGVAIGDLDGDGDADLVASGLASGGGCDVSVLRGNGDGTFQAAVHYQIGGTAAVKVGITDLDGDGDADLVIADDGGRIWVLRGNGDGTFAAGIPYPAGSTTYSVAIGDVDGDGDGDVVAANYDGDRDQIVVLRGNGDGTLGAAVAYPAGPTPYDAVLGDVNGDGHLDVVVADFGDGNASMLAGAGDGSFGPPVSYAIGGNPYSVALGDLNGDTRLDVAVTNVWQVVVLTGLGDGSMLPAVGFSSAGNPQSAALGDLNGDGATDIVATNANVNYISVLLNAQ